MYSTTLLTLVPTTPITRHNFLFKHQQWWPSRDMLWSLLTVQPRCIAQTIQDEESWVPDRCILQDFFGCCLDSLMSLASQFCCQIKCVTKQFENLLVSHCFKNICWLWESSPFRPRLRITKWMNGLSCPITNKTFQFVCRNLKDSPKSQSCFDDEPVGLILTQFV